ncbi:MAG: universal stress protein [Gemmatimonadaceae bacterium]
MLKTVLVPLDGSSLAERALPIALDIARRAEGAVHLVRAHTPLAIVGATAEGIMTQDMLRADDSLRERARQYLTARASRLGADGGLPVTAHVEDGSPAGLITQVADEIAADLIVMTTHGAGGFAPAWLGSITDAVIRHSHRPVLALPANDARADVPFTPRRIMVTLDGSDNAAAILPVARALAVLFGAQVDLVRAISPYVPGDVVSALAADTPDPYGVDISAARAKAELDVVARELEAAGLITHATVRVELSPTRAVLDHIKETDPDCIAVATQGRGLSRFLLGSVADKLIRSGLRPTLVLRPPKA